MTFSFQTGSEALRDTEILKYSYVFEPISDERFAVSGGIYSVPLGQDIPADFTFNTGSLTKDGEYLSIEKIRYIFESEDDANKFITDIGPENIVLYYENKTFDFLNHKETLWHIVEVINFPQFEISTNFFNFEETKGFRIEVLKELPSVNNNSVLESMDRRFVDDDKHGIILEPFLLYFDLENSDAK